MLDLYKIMGVYHAFKFRQRMSDEKEKLDGEHTIRRQNRPKCGSQPIV